MPYLYSLSQRVHKFPCMHCLLMLCLITSESQQTDEVRTCTCTWLCLTVHNFSKKQRAKFFCAWSLVFLQIRACGQWDSRFGAPFQYQSPIVSHRCPLLALLPASFFLPPQKSRTENAVVCAIFPSML